MPNWDSQELIQWIVLYGLRVLGAVLILILGRVAAGVGRKTVRKLLVRTRADETVVSFVSTLVFVLILVFAVLAALAKFGIQTTSLVAVLGAAGFAVGFALQGSLANFAAGILILVLRPFRVGDFVQVAGESGTVKEIQLLSTVLATPDNVKIIVSSAKIFSDTIRNVSAYDRRRVDLVVGIGYGSDVRKAFDVLSDLLKGDERVLSDPPPQIAVSELADSSVNLVVRPWVKTEDYWPVKFGLTQRIKESFDRHGIEIPFPQRVVHTIPADTTL